MDPHLFIVVFLSLNLHVLAEDTFSEFELAGLEAHNDYRAIHGLPPMTLSRKICDWAQSWANYLAKNNAWSHRPNNMYGENLYVYSDLNPNILPTVDLAVKSWYDEIQLYDYNHPAFSNKTGHFTGILWSDTLELGIAKATNKHAARTFIVANYNSPGHWEKKLRTINAPAYAPAFAPVNAAVTDVFYSNGFISYLIWIAVLIYLV